MPLTLDTSHALRTVPELRALVDAIFNARKEDENDAVEWKGEVDDVGAKRWTVEVARHAIGMGNRDPDSAAATFEGCGYVVLGVEPGRYWGVRALDPADADNKLALYLGTAGVRCRWDTVNVGGFDIAVVTVEPPRWGDPIRCLEKAYSDNDRSYQKGTVFVRRHGKTEQASPDELRALTRRATLQRERLDLRVELQSEGPLAVVDDNPEVVHQWIEDQRTQAIAAAKLHLSPPASSRLPMAALLNSVAQTMAAFSRPETRSLEEYEDEYAAWVTRARGVVPAVVRHLIVSSGAARIRPAIINTTDRNFMKVDVELRALTPGVTIHLANGRRAPKMPSQPRSFGPRPAVFAGSLLSTALPVVATPPLPSSIWVDAADPMLIHFSTRDVRPQSTSNLGLLTILGNRDVAGGTVQLEWSATATNVDGRLSGIHTLTFTSTVLSAADILDAEHAADDKVDEADED